MKFKTLFFLFFVISSFVYSEDYIGLKYANLFQSITFQEKSIIYSYWDAEKDDTFTETLACEYVDENKIQFIEFVSNQKWLLIGNEEFLFVYDSENSKPFFFGTSKYIPNLEAFHLESDIFQATSYLEEGKTVYIPDNLRMMDTNKPWSEGVSGDGIGEKIILEGNTSMRFFISNGYVSFNKPYLYEYNSRLKKILVRTLETGKEFIFELEDTPGLQTIVLDDFYGGVEFEILEVFEGSKYEDTCVNFIFGN